MNTDEARQVLWLKSNPRPIGELLDGGYLTQDRLEWAAEWAYDFKLKQAARVLLESMKNPAPKVQVGTKPLWKTDAERSLPIGVSLDKARATPWPFQPYKGQPMGTLVDAKQLSLKDLGYAVENAWDERVRQAATVLSLIRLDQVIKEPSPSAGFIKVNSGGRSYSERWQLFLVLMEGLFFGAILTAAIIWFVTQLIDASGPNPNAKPLSYFLSSASGTVGLVIGLVFIGFIGWLAYYLSDLVTKKLDRQIEYYRRGQEGEDRVVELIVQALDGNWHLFRNIGIPGRNKGDLDFVLVGPPGIWVLEVKNFRGNYRNTGEDWEYQKGKKWITISKSPSRQAFNNALRLANFLKADGLNVFVNAAVIWANEESPLLVENPSVAVWTYSRLADELGNIWRGEKISEPERRKITDKLSKICEKAEKEHQLNWEGQRDTG